MWEKNVQKKKVSSRLKIKSQKREKKKRGIILA